MKTVILASLGMLTATAFFASASSVPDLANSHSTDSGALETPKWLTGESANIGGFLFPHAHFQSTYGATTADSLEHFGAGHHDPVRDGWTIQGFEFGSSLRAGEHLEAFATYHLFQDAETRNWDGEFEEWFGKIKNLSGGLSLRGGRYLNRFGFQNQTHSHGWDFADNNLLNGRFLGDDGLSSIGGEVTWEMPSPWTSLLSLSIGQAQIEEHEHDEEEHHDDHDHAPLFEGESALFDSAIVTGNWTNEKDYNDFHQFRFGLSGAWGSNGLNGNSQVYGAHAEYTWRENGYESGGRYFRWRNEIALRSFDYQVASEEDEHHVELEHDHHEHSTASGREDEFGAYTMLSYGLDSGWVFGLRGEYVSGIAIAELAERWRVSPMVTYYLNPQRTFYCRGQYNYDRGSSFGNEHSVWLQLGFNWGGAEVR